LRYIDDLVLREKGEERLYSLADPNWNVIAICNVSGDVQERYMYDAFGKRNVFDADFTAKTGTTFNWNRAFTGQVIDIETSLMLYRERYYNVLLGRFVTRDPINYEDDSCNIYRYIKNQSTSYVDSMGLMLDSISAAIRGCLQCGSYYQKLKCLENLLETLGESGCFNLDKVKKAIETLKNTPVRNLIQGTLKKAKSYASELEGMTVTELQKLANSKGPLADKARAMLKLVRESERLMEKQCGKPR
jgi:RHS repeat-associated protein